MRRLIAVLLLSSVLIFSLVAASGEVIPLGSSFYDDIDILFILNGRSIPSASRPWTKAEALNELKKLDPSGLDPRLSEIYDRLLDEVEPDAVYAVKASAVLYPELYIHTNEAFDTEQWWIYGYAKRNPLFNGILEGFAGGFAFHTELSAGIGRVSASDRIGTVQQYAEEVLGLEWAGIDSFPVDVSSRPYVLSSGIYSPLFKFNLPATGEAEVQTPRTAWFVYAWDNGSIGIYKAGKTWGKTLLGNYIYDSHIRTYDYFSAKFFNGILNYDLTLMFPYSYLGGNAYDYKIEYQRIFLSHRIAVQFTPNFNFTLSENVMYWLRDGFEPLFANPALIFHNNVESYLFNAIAHIELEYVPVKGLRCYLQLGVDQGSIPGFEDVATEDLAAGLTIGGEYHMVLDCGILGVGLEGALVTPAMYRRLTPTYPDFILAELTIVGDDTYSVVPLFSYMGFPLGGDVFALQARCDYRTGSLTAGFSTSLIWKGAQSIFRHKDTITGLNLTEPVNFGLVAEASAKYDMTCWKHFPVSFSLVVDGIYNRQKGFDLQMTIGASISATGRLFEK